MNKKEDIKDWMEKMKEIQGLQYDYFKYLMPLSTGSILILIAFMEKIFVNLSTCEKIIIFVSLLAFLITIIFSLCTLPVITNMIMYITGMQKATIDNNLTKEDEKEVFELYGKFENALDHTKKIGIIVVSSYITGISLILVVMLSQFIRI